MSIAIKEIKSLFKAHSAKKIVDLTGLTGVFYQTGKTCPTFYGLFLGIE